jgi:class 3 adenylate cyclase
MQKIASILRLEGPVFDAGTLARLELDVAANRNSGLLVKSAEDHLLLLFPRAKSAVTCAVELQRIDAGTSAEQKMPALLRGAVALAPVSIREDIVEGDAVEIAANLATILEPGDVFVSGGCREIIGDGLPVDYEPLREGSSAGYRVLVDANEILSAIRHENPVPPDWSWKIAVPMIAMMLLIGLSWIWFNLPEPTRP